eukprot:1159870-Pelagomonas_calceolata.AAC.5
MNVPVLRKGLGKVKSCPDTNPFPTLDIATAQHANTITRLKTRSLRNPNRNYKASGEVCWARGGGVHEKESLGVQEHGGQPSRSPACRQDVTSGHLPMHELVGRAKDDEVSPADLLNGKESEGTRRTACDGLYHLIMPFPYGVNIVPW